MSTEAQGGQSDFLAGFNLLSFSKDVKVKAGTNGTKQNLAKSYSNLDESFFFWGLSD